MALFSFVFGRRKIADRAARRHPVDRGVALRQGPRRVDPVDAARELADALAIKGVPVEALLRDFPHVVNRLALDWNDPARLKNLFDELLIDRRGTRQGFPPDALAELLALHRFCVPFFPKAQWSPWDGVKNR